MPSYARKRVFDVCPSEGRRGIISQTPVLVGVRFSKPIGTRKFINQSSIKSPGPGGVSEWVLALFYKYKLIENSYTNISEDKISATDNF